MTYNLLSHDENILFITQLITYWCDYDIYDEKQENSDGARFLMWQTEIYDVTKIKRLLGFRSALAAHHKSV